MVNPVVPTTDREGGATHMSGRTPDADAGPRLHLLGGFELRCDGRAVPVPRSAQRLAAFLAVRGRPQQRIAVAGRLWPDVPDDRAQACLRSALWRLRAGDTSLATATRDEVALAPEVAVDLHELEAAIDGALGSGDGPPATPRVLRLLGREVLPGWYEDWAVTERERLKNLSLHALEALAERLLERDRPRDAARCAFAAVQGEPLRESSQRLLIRAHLADGNTALAVRSYDAYRATLAEEIGEEPSWLMADVRNAIWAAHPG